MSDGYLKCSCRTCGGHIEFPSQAVGLSIGCPHCGATTDLYAPEETVPAPIRVAAPPPLPRIQATAVQRPAAPMPPAGPGLKVATAPPPTAVETVPETEDEFAEPQFASSSEQGINWIGWSLSGVSVLLLIIGGLLYLDNVKHGRNVLIPRKYSRSLENGPASASKDDTEDEEETKPATKNAGAAASPAAPAKSIEDLKASTISLQKTPGRNLTYAIGTLRNESDLQRFGVRLELDLFDSGGNKVGVAKDYIRVIEPRKEWHFRAMVLAPKTTSVKVAKITEQE